MPPKEVIDVAAARAALKAGKIRRNTFLGYGNTRTGKTRFLGTMPRPVIIADKSEGGYTTLLNMNEEAFYEKTRMPIIYPVTSAGEMSLAWTEVRDRVRREPDWAWTLGVDSVTFYADGYRSAIERELVEKGKGIDGRYIYNMLEGHLRYVMKDIHETWPGDVFWTALLKDPDPGGEGRPGKPGGPLIGGQTDKKAGARVDFFWRFSIDSNGEHEIITKGNAVFPAGGRDEGKLPAAIKAGNPKLGITFRDFEKLYYGNHRIP